MRKNIFRKSLGLIALYAVIIIGIFVVQFRNDSIIRKTIQSMRVTLIGFEDPSEKNSTQNSNKVKKQFQITYNGIQFICDESKPVEFDFNGKTKIASLKSFQEADSSITLTFSNNIKLTFTVAENSQNSPLMISADFPEEISYISLCSKPLNGFSFTDVKSKQAIIEGKNSSYSLVAPMLQDTKLVLLQNSKFARYSPFIKQTEFSIAAASELASATKLEWQNTISSLSSTIINEFTKQRQSDPSFITNLTEQTVISYVVAMSNVGRYNEALNTVPDSFIKGTKRTYLSAPFFGSLAKVTPGLHIQMENYKNMILHAIESSSCDVFAMENIDEYILINSSNSSVQKLLDIPANLTENNFTVTTAAAILKVYSTLKDENPELAEKLVPVLEPCLKKITDACKLDGDKVRIAENDTNLSVIAAVSIGDAFIQYGIAAQIASVEKCGYLIINSYLSDLSGLDLRTLCGIYPVAIHNNPYYPHFAKIRTLEGETLWAWTITKDIKITQDENRTLYIDINFPLGLTHYVILNGISPFRRIQIYNMDFRTDPQFEIYNSSGYVYRSATKSLLLKSRHKSQHEIIKLYYREIPTQQDESTQTITQES